jgi:hypothetical protein
MPQGFVYILASPNSDYIKIGRTEQPIRERLRGINGNEAYAPHGPWELLDFVYVTDCTHVESAAHRHFRDRHVFVEGTNELFSIPPHEAREQLRLISAPLRVDAQRTDQLFHNSDVRLFLSRLFELSGLCTSSKFTNKYSELRDYWRCEHAYPLSMMLFPELCQAFE